MMRVTWRHYGGGCLFLLAFIAALRILLTPNNNTLEPKVSNATITRLVDQAEPLFRALLPTWDTLHIAVYPARSFQFNGSRQNLWQVECLDDNSNEIAHLIWDDTNKRTLLISRIGAAPYAKDAAPVRKDRAIAMARAWLTSLRLTKSGEAQTARCEVQTGTDVWYFRIYLPEGTAALWMNARSGEFVQAKMSLIT